MYRRYAHELKEQACGLVIGQGYVPATAAGQLGVPEMTLRGWLAKRDWKGVRQMAEHPLPESDDPKVLQARIRELTARLRRAEMERDILKKATAYFAGPHLSDSPGSTSIESSSK